MVCLLHCTGMQINFDIFSQTKTPSKSTCMGWNKLEREDTIVIFEGKMNATGYISILEVGLKLFIRDVIPDVKFMQDNDPKHTSNRAQQWIEKENINWWKTPAESPDMNRFNPVENLWHELKEYLRREVKPKTKDQLIAGIEEFWKTVSVAKCQKYISHLRKVVPKVIELNGGPTGY